MKMGAHHTLEIELNNKLTLAKERLRATLYDHSHDAKGRGKETSQYMMYTGVTYLYSAVCLSVLSFSAVPTDFFLTQAPQPSPEQDRWDAMHLQALDDATDVHKTSEDS